jgi:hypothetical protein
MAGTVQAVLKNCKGLHVGVAGIRAKYDPSSGATYLQACSNVVIKQGGRISRRKGTEKKNEQAASAIFSDRVDCVVHTGAALYRVRSDYSLEGLRNLEHSEMPMFFAESPEGIFYSNGVERGRIERFGPSYTWEKSDEEYSPQKTLALNGPPDFFTHIHHHNGRMLCAVDKVVYYSDYRSYGNFYYERDMLQYPDKVIGFASVQKTLFVFTETGVYSYIGDNMATAQEVFASNIPALEGTICTIRSKQSESNTLPIWTTRLGIYVGSPNGTVQNVTDDRFVLPDVAVRGKAVVHDGQYFVTVKR